METEAELKTLRHNLARGTPFGDIHWQTKTAAKLNLDSSLRPPGRPGRLENQHVPFCDLHQFGLGEPFVLSTSCELRDPRMGMESTGAMAVSRLGGSQSSKLAALVPPGGTSKVNFEADDEYSAGAICFGPRSFAFASDSFAIAIPGPPGASTCPDNLAFCRVARQSRTVNEQSHPEFQGGFASRQKLSESFAAPVTLSSQSLLLVSRSMEQ